MVVPAIVVVAAAFDEAQVLDFVLAIPPLVVAVLEFVELVGHYVESNLILSFSNHQLLISVVVLIERLTIDWRHGDRPRYPLAKRMSVMRRRLKRLLQSLLFPW